MVGCGRGTSVGKDSGTTDGDLVGAGTGRGVGVRVGSGTGLCVGRGVGSCVGQGVGSCVGWTLREGSGVGLRVAIMATTESYSVTVASGNAAVTLVWNAGSSSSATAKVETLAEFEVVAGKSNTTSHVKSRSFRRRALLSVNVTAKFFTGPRCSSSCPLSAVLSLSVGGAEALSSHTISTFCVSPAVGAREGAGVGFSVGKGVSVG